MKKILLIVIIIIIFCSLPAADTTLEWKRLVSNAPFLPRVFASSAVYKGRLWLIGGGSSVYRAREFYNDVWYTSNGIDWVLATGNAAFAPRERHTTFVFDGKLWVVAGLLTSGTYCKDVWSSVDGVDWVLVTGNAAFDGRAGQVQTNMVLGNKMWIITGQNQKTGPVNDAWFSENGSDWFAATRNTEFTGRSGLSGCVHDDKLWIGGGASASSSVNDIWSSVDGEKWVQGGDIWPVEIQHPNIFSFHDKLWVLGGSRPGLDIQNYDRVQSSVDGKIWVYNSSGFGSHGASSLEVFNNMIYLMAGGAADNAREQSALNDVWRAVYSSPTITPVHTLTVTVTPTQTMTLPIVATEPVIKFTPTPDK